MVTFYLQKHFNMVILESRSVTDENFKEKYVDGYFLTIYDMVRLVRDFQADCHDGFVSNDLSYIEQWLKTHDRI